MKTIDKRNLFVLALAGGLAAALLGATDARAQNDDPIGNEYRVTLFPYHRINDELTGFGYLGYVNNPDKEYQTGYNGCSTAETRVIDAAAMD